MSKTTKDQLTLLTQDWGGDGAADENGNTNPYAKTSDELPFSGLQIQKFVKQYCGKVASQAGYWCVSDSVDSSSYYHLWGYATKADHDEDAENNRMFDVVIPISTVQGDSYGAYLYTDKSNSDNLIVTEDSYEVNLRFCAVQVSNSERLNYGSKGTLQIDRSSDGGSTWETVATLANAIKSSNYADSEDYTPIDIGSYLSNGSQEIRVRASFQYEDAEGNTKTATSAYVAIGASITKTTLALTCMMDWQRAITDLDNGIPLSYAIFGTGVSKTLNIRIYDKDQNLYRSLTYTIGTNVYPLTQPWTTDSGIVDSATDSVKVLTHGVHTIEAWLTCTDSNNVTYSSPHYKNQVMVVADAANTNHYMMIQQVEGIAEGTTGSPYFEAENYVQKEELFQFAVYDPTNASTGMKVSLSIDNSAGDTNYMKLEKMCTNATKYTVPATIQIEDATVGSTSFAYLSATDADNVSILASKNSAKLIIAVSNEHDFTPTKGADLYINPANRNNDEENPAQMLNAAKSNAVVPCTFSGLNFDNNDGWLQDSDGNRVFRVLAGQKVVLGYDPFAEFQTNYSANVTIEMDIKVSNVTNETDPIIAILNAVVASGLYTGVKMCPLEGAVMTSSQTTYGQQNFGWREDKREHIAINICSAIYADTAISDTIALVRVFVNGNPYREFEFAKDKGEWGSNSYNIEIGQSGADIDIYSLKVYKKALSAQNIMQDYKSSLPTSAEKISFTNNNDILSTDGTISYTEAKKKYSCIVHHGRPTSLQHPDSTTCWLQIDHMVNGVYDNATSGTICKATKTLPVKGQGSTAKHYCDWNQQYDVKKSVVPSDDATGMSYIEKKADDGSVTKLPAITVDGSLVQDGWVDGNGKYKGVYYQLNTSTDAKANKLVGKVNTASCMQSHKMGSINAYNALYRQVMGDSLDTIMKEDSKARCTCKEDWFLFFVDENDTGNPDDYEFQGIMTFGSGKMDKKIWGYDEDTYPDFAMFEGSDNDQPVTNFERPWNDDVAYNPAEEYYEYNGKGNIDFDAGATEVIDEKEYPTGAAVTAMKAFINFGYLHCTDILPWTTNGGTATSLLAAGNSGTNIHKQYWVTVADSKAALGDLYSWSPKKLTWVPAGVNEETRNVFSENPSVTFSADYEETNTALINAIITKFKANAGTYFNVRSCLFHSCFVQNLLAGSDNCAKNTYYVVDPTKHIINFHADDLDTIFKTDNVGWQTKPYYVDRVNHIDEDGNECYSGTHNMFFNTFDRAYESEKASMMKDIFTAMATLSGSITEFFEDYYFGIQTAIPTICYIEQARMRYERRQIQVNNGDITLDTVAPITQQLGSQLESELQYMDRRLVYFESYAAYGVFGVGGGGNNFGFRGYPKRDGSGARISFTLKPHQYIYPTAAFGQTLINPHVRLAPGDSYEIVLEESCSSDTTCTLFGIDYYKEIGNLADLSVNPAYGITIGGKRLIKVDAIPSSGSGEFRPSQMSISAVLVENVAIKCADVGQNLDLRSQTRLQTVDVRDSSLNKVSLPETRTLTSVQLGKKISDITLGGQPNLATFTLDSYEYVKDVSVDASTLGSLDTLVLAQSIYNAAPTGIESISFTGVDWGSGTNKPTPSMVMWMVGYDATLSGKIDSSTLTATYMMSDKLTLINKYGDIDSETNSLYLLYKLVAVESMGIVGERFIYPAKCIKNEDGTYKYDGYSLSSLPLRGNNISIKDGKADITWTLESNAYGVVNNANTGELKVSAFSAQDLKYTLTATANLMDGSTLSATAKIGFYRRIPKLGDFAYLDGTFDDEYDASRDLAGIVYARLWYQYNPDEDLPSGVTSNPILSYELVGGDYVIDTKAKFMKLFIVSKEYMSQKTTDQEATPISSGMAWGLYNDNSSGSNGFSTTEMATILSAINTATGKAYTSIFNVPELTEYSDTPVKNPSGSLIWYAYANCIQDDYPSDTFDQYGGFRYNNTPQGGSSNAMKDWNGKSNTQKIVNWVNNIIEYYLVDNYDADRPTTLQELADLMYNVLYKKVGDGTKSKYYQFAFPAAYACKLYEPTQNKSTIDDQYKCGNWYLPSVGELTRMYHHFNISRKSPMTTSNTSNNSNVPSADYASYDADQGHEGVDAWNPIFAKAYKRISSAGGSSSVLTNLSASYHWSSSEYGSTIAWGVSFIYSFVSSNYGYSKYNGFSVRPVVAYMFEL